MLKNRFVLFLILSILFFFPAMNSAHAGKKIKVVATLEFLAVWVLQIRQAQISIVFVHARILDVLYF